MGASGAGLVSRLEALSASDPGRPLLGSADRWYSAGEVRDYAERMGQRLKELGIGEGTWAGLSVRQTPGCCMALLALRFAGAVAVLEDPRAPDGFPVAWRIAQTGPEQFTVTPEGGTEKAVALDVSALPPAEGGRAPDGTGPAFVVFTSGSTGKKKAAVLSEENLIFNLLASREPGDCRASDRALGCLPMHHVFGLALFVGCVVLGYSIYFPESRDPRVLLRAIEKERLTRMNGVPSLYLALAERCGDFDVSSLRTGFIGGGPVTPEQFRAMEEKLGMTLVPVYGMTECIGIACGDFRDSPEVRAVCAGYVYPGNTVTILREDGTAAERGGTGEIFVSGPMRMLGYADEMMAEDGPLATGDLGYFDGQGRLRITGRKKDIVIRNGNNLSIPWLEEGIRRAPGVRDCAVAALWDERQGEVPAAMVVTDGRREIAPDLPGYALPVLYVFVDEIPLTGSGKPDRQRIREVLARCRNGTC